MCVCTKVSVLYLLNSYVFYRPRPRKKILILIWCVIVCSEGRWQFGRRRACQHLSTFYFCLSYIKHWYFATVQTESCQISPARRSAHTAVTSFPFQTASMFVLTPNSKRSDFSIEITNKMQPCNRIYYPTIHWRLKMFPAAYRSSSGALTVFATSGLHTRVVTGRSQVWVGT